ncbi:MAG: ABC-type transporter, periplasmic subunit [Gemmatimonadetes bacterium]|nr:ABC-type transporter, periplasmic subunit [Gemmatimonadota bacterium]
MFSRISPRRALLASVVVAILAVAGCKGTEQATTAGPNDVGGTIIVSIAADAGSLLPELVTTITDRQVTDLLYDRLADMPDNLNAIGDVGYKPQLAERWVWAPDSLSIAFHINPHAKWHDGLPVRASDVRYSLNLIKDPALGSPVLPLITNIDSVSVRDSLTAVAYFKRHTPEMFYDLVYQVLIVPEHILGNTPAGQLKDAEVGRRGIGSGRFRLGKWEPGTRIELLADTGNYRGRAKVDRVVFSISPDFNTASTRFFAGDADVFENLRPEHFAKLVGDTARRSQPYPTLGYAVVAFNLKDPKNLSLPNPIFSERAVRRALTMAVDRRAMLKNVFDTLGKPLYGPFVSALAFADTTLPQLPYDTVKAKALLDSAGWVVGPDGVRAKAGRRLEFSLTTPSSSAARKQYAVLLQDALRRVGAVVKIDESDFASATAKQTARGFDAEMGLWNTDPSISGIRQSWSTVAIGKDGTNYTSYSNPSVDALLDSAVLAFDPARARSYSRRAFETMIEDAPAIWLYELTARAGIHKRIHTTTMRADGYWSGLADWWIPASQRNARDKIGLRPAQ